MDSAAAGAAPATYDRIGAGYRQVRVPDPRLAALIRQALAEPRSVVNVGAGTGSYEPDHVHVTAVDPSQVMLDQHPGTDKVRAGAQDLPFVDGAFDAAMAVMTVHHWPDLHRGLAELRRVARRQLVFTWDPTHPRELWLLDEYLPEIRALEHARFTPPRTGQRGLRLPPPHRRFTGLTPRPLIPALGPPGPVRRRPHAPSPAVLCRKRIMRRDDLY
jgi:SAM-dependent methyltransferase